jgi:hypothetical protein
MGRLILSILAGFLFTAILSTAIDHVFHITGVYPPYGEPMRDSGLLLIAFTYRAILAVAGSYLTASIAKEKAMKAVLILGTIGSLLWLAGAIAMWEFAAPWYNVLGVLTGVPFSLLGGKLYEKRAQAAR